MRRDTFLKSMAALAAAGGLPLSAWAAANVKMMIPANPGGGWDTTGRALGKALQEAKVADSVTYDNKGGAAGALGLAQFVNSSKGDPNAMMVMGAVMLGGIITGKPPVSLSQATPIARITSEYNGFVLPANSPFKTMADVVAQLKKDPGSVKWGGGSRGSTEHIAAAMIAREVGVDPAKINYVAFRGGGEAIAAILGGNVTVGGGGCSELAEYITTGKMRAIAVTSDTRLKGINVPTLKEQGINVVIGNWRGVYGAPGITAAQRKALTEMMSRPPRPSPGPSRWRRTTGRRPCSPARRSTSSSTTTSPACAPPWSSPAWSDAPRRARQVRRASRRAAMKLMQTLVGAGVSCSVALCGRRRIPSAAGYGGIGPTSCPGWWPVCWRCAAYSSSARRDAAAFRTWSEPRAPTRPLDGLVWVSAGLLANAALITTIGFIFSCTLCYVLAVRGCAVGQRRSS